MHTLSPEIHYAYIGYTDTISQLKMSVVQYCKHSRINCVITSFSCHLCKWKE